MVLCSEWQVATLVKVEKSQETEGLAQSVDLRKNDVRQDRMTHLRSTEEDASVEVHPSSQIHGTGHLLDPGIDYDHHLQQFLEDDLVRPALSQCQLTPQG